MVGRGDLLPLDDCRCSLLSCPLELVSCCVWHNTVCCLAAEERSQAMNKAKAMAYLKAKLVAIAEEQRAAEIREIRGDIVKAEWGQQIRNYVLHPYKLVKDVRSEHETTDVGSVLDGDIGAFIDAYLRMKSNKSTT